MTIERYADAWDSIEDDPVERERLKMQSHLLTALQDQIKAWNVTQAKAATRLGTTQPRLNDVLRDWLNKFSLGALFDLRTRTGLKVRLSINRTDKKAKSSKHGS